MIESSDESFTDSILILRDSVLRENSSDDFVVGGVIPHFPMGDPLREMRDLQSLY